MGSGTNSSSRRGVNTLIKEIPLRYKLFLGLAIAVLASLGVVYTVATHFLLSDTKGFIATEHATQIEGIKSELAAYYSEKSTWDGIEDVFSSHGQNRSSERGQGGAFLLTDPDGRVIYASSPGMNRPDLSSRLLSVSIPITISGKKVGLLFTAPLLGQFSDVEVSLLSSVRRTIAYAAVISLGIALLIGLVLVRFVTAPFARLTAATQAISAGDLTRPIPSSSRDEIGRLAHVLDDLRVGLSRSEEARKRMLADVAHELRNPLAVVKAKVEAMLDGVQPADEENLLKVSERLEHLEGLIEELQDIALAEADELPLDRKAVDLNDFFNGVAEDARTLFSEEGKEFHLDISPDLPEPYADPRRLHQIVWNLLSNALRHTKPEDAVTLHVEPRNGEVLIQVSDTGEGMPKEVASHVFDRFYKEKGSKGLGLGLAITEALVEAHGGRIWVDTALSEGTTFFFTIPTSSPDSCS